jgi:hypothetical protein
VDEVAAGSMPKAAKQFSGNETWSRLNADPMLTMKRVEMEKIKKVQENAKIARLQVGLFHYLMATQCASAQQCLR